MKKEGRIKIILTGGHLSPMLAVLDALEAQAECVVIGRKHVFEKDNAVSLEHEILHARKIPFYNLSAARLQRKFTSKTLSSLFKAPGSLFSARRILLHEKPDAVLTFGGYIGLPVSLAAKSLGIPVVLHEQTQKAGLTNRIISKFAYKICVSFPSSIPFFPEGKTVITGNPIRPEVLHVQEKLDLHIQKPMLTIMGGSSGSHTINEVVRGCLPEILAKFTVLHQVGDTKEFNDYDVMSEIKKGLPEVLAKRYNVVKFILPQHIGWVYKNSEIILSRAGANTVSELLALGKKAVLIPLPIAGKNEQLENAILYKKSGLGDFIEQKNASCGVLLNMLLDVNNKKVNTTVGDWYNKNASKKIAEIVLTAARQYENKVISPSKG